MPQVDGRTALHYAAENDHAEVVKTLLKQGNVNPHTINNVSFFILIFIVCKLKPYFTFLILPFGSWERQREKQQLTPN